MKIIIESMILLGILVISSCVSHPKSRLKSKTSMMRTDSLALPELIETETSPKIEDALSSWLEVAPPKVDTKSNPSESIVTEEQKQIDYLNKAIKLLEHPERDEEFVTYFPMLDVFYEETASQKVQIILERYLESLIKTVGL